MLGPQLFPLLFGSERVVLRYSSVWKYCDVVSKYFVLYATVWSYSIVVRYSLSLVLRSDVTNASGLFLSFGNST